MPDAEPLDTRPALYVVWANDTGRRYIFDTDEDREDFITRNAGPMWKAYRRTNASDRRS